jgi:hypothetical protein
MILNLGVVDVSYGAGPAAPKRVAKASKNPRPRARKSGAGAAPVTTGDVAQWLENRYHVVEHFWELHGQEVADDFADSLSGSLESFLMGAPADLNPYGTALSKTEDRFRQMLSLRELDQLGYPGIPTMAAKRGVSSRHKSGFTKNRQPRPSFLDSGLYSRSFTAWVEG